jgi:hypothetical protein
MANTILIKRSSVPDAVPTTGDLQFGELAVNTNDGRLFLKYDSGSGEQVTIVGGAEADFVYYVSKSGNDGNTGKSLSTAFLTIKAAVAAANAQIISALPATNVRICIFVKSGDYTEDNPIDVQPRITLWGDNLRSVSVRPLTPAVDIFWLRQGCYINGFTFRDHLSPAAAIAFPASGNSTNNIINTSPYVQNCSSITTTGAGMRVDGSKAGGLKSMVTDAYTQINQGGIGIHILNQGYAQLVSIFTICTQDGILAESGGYCSVTNSNSSFGTIGLRANGVSPVLYSGVSDGVDQIGNIINVDGLPNTPYNNNAVSFDGGLTYYTIYNATSLNGSKTYVSGGISPSTTLVLDDVIGVYIGAELTGPAFTLGQNVTGILNETTITISASADGPLSPGDIIPFTGTRSTLELANTVVGSIPDNTPAIFVQRSTINASSHTFEYIGTGNNLATALPQAGGVPIQANEVVQTNGGEVVYTSTDQRGDFRIGDQLTINSVQGTITGEAFDKSLFAVLTPYILALEG